MSRQTTAPRHRRRLPAVTRKQLRARVRDLKDARRHDRHQLDGAERYMGDLRARNTELEERVKELEQQAAVRDAEHKAQREADFVDAGVLRQQHETLQAAHVDLTTDYLAVKAELENATAVTVPPGVRDTTDPDDQQTEPIYVATWQKWLADQERAAATPKVKSLADAVAGGES